VLYLCRVVEGVFFNHRFAFGPKRILASRETLNLNPGDLLKPFGGLVLFEPPDDVRGNADIEKLPEFSEMALSRFGGVRRGPGNLEASSMPLTFGVKVNWFSRRYGR
jgi:hypothetical protein